MMGLREGIAAYLLVTLLCVMISIGLCFFYDLKETETTLSVVVAIFAIFGGTIVEAGGA